MSCRRQKAVISVRYNSSVSTRVGDQAAQDRPIEIFISLPTLIEQHECACVKGRPISQVLDDKLLTFLAAERGRDRDASIPELLRRAEQYDIVPDASDIDRTSAWRAMRRMGVQTRRRKQPAGADTRRFRYAERMQMVLLGAGIPLEAIGILLVVERPLDTIRTPCKAPVKKPASARRLLSLRGSRRLSGTARRKSSPCAS